MLKQIGQIISVVTYALLTLAAPGLIVCTHSDGRTMIELAASPCCLIEVEKTNCCTCDSDSHSEESAASSKDSCVDSPVQISNALPGQIASLGELSLPAMCIDLTFTIAPDYKSSIQARTDFHDPPPSIVLVSLPTIIILC